MMDLFAKTRHESRASFPHSGTQHGVRRHSDQHLKIHSRWAELDSLKAGLSGLLTRCAHSGFDKSQSDVEAWLTRNAAQHPYPPESHPPSFHTCRATAVEDPPPW